MLPLVTMKPDKLITWRNKYSLTQSDLGSMLGVTNACISRWESGARKIPSFLHLALECLEMKGGVVKVKGKKKTRKKKEVEK
jgi:DNA-binding transcriptional regulator YiaG